MKIYAHRGASAYAPENTMAAFELAQKMGADGIELDVQLTSDGELVVIHDHELSRVSNGKGCVKDHTLSELKALDFGGWFSSEYAGQRIPTLRETLSWIATTGMELNIEIKAAPIYHDVRMIPVVVKQVGTSGMLDRIVVSSFDHRCLLEVRKADERIVTGLLYSANLVDVGAYAAKCGARFIHPHFAFVDESAIYECTLNGIGINVWTVDDPQLAVQMQRLGINILISNAPDKVATK